MFSVLSCCPPFLFFARRFCFGICLYCFHTRRLCCVHACPYLFRHVVIFVFPLLVFVFSVFIVPAFLYTMFHLVLNITFVRRFSSTLTKTWWLGGRVGGWGGEQPAVAVGTEAAIAVETGVCNTRAKLAKCFCVGEIVFLGGLYLLIFPSNPQDGT